MKHERAIVMGLAYFIGFTTAFIGYGLVTGNDYLAPLVSAPNSSQLASVTATRSSQESKQPSVVVSISATADDYADDLYMSVGDESRLISVAYGTNEGYESGHISITQALLSPNQKQLFFCKTTIKSYETCEPYVYDWGTNSLFPVSFNDELIMLGASDYTTSWSSDGSLIVGSNTSVDTAAPWRL